MRPAASQRSAIICHNDHRVPDLRRRAHAHHDFIARGFPFAVPHSLSVVPTDAHGRANPKPRPHADPFGNRCFDSYSHGHALTNTSTHAYPFRQRD